MKYKTIAINILLLLFSAMLVNGQTFKLGKPICTFLEPPKQSFFYDNYVPYHDIKIGYGNQLNNSRQLAYLSYGHNFYFLNIGAGFEYFTFNNNNVFSLDGYLKLTPLNFRLGKKMDLYNRFYIVTCLTYSKSIFDNLNYDNIVLNFGIIKKIFKRPFYIELLLNYNLMTSEIDNYTMLFPSLNVHYLLIRNKK